MLSDNELTQAQKNSKSNISAHLISAITKSKATGKARTNKHKQKNIKDPCGICHKSVRKNQKAVQCSSCNQWIHFIKCNQSTLSEYYILMDEDDNVPWHCIQCVIKQYAEIFPFGLLTKNELLELLEIDIPSFLEAFLHLA